MSKKKNLIIVAILLFVVGLFILFKACCYSVYMSCISEMDLEELVTNMKKTNEILVDTTKNSNSLSFDGIAIGNYFSDFVYDSEMSGEDASIYYQYKNGKKVGMFSASTFEQLISAAKKGDMMFYIGDAEPPRISFSSIMYAGFEGFIESNNIKDDVDLMKAMSEYDYNQEFNIFTPLSKLRDDFSIKLVASVALPSIDNIYFLSGDLKGYMFEINANERSCYEINIIENGKRYIFTILSDSFDLEDIKEIINSIYFV